MNIIELARKSGGADITSNGWTSWVGTQSTEFLERFAALVRAEAINETVKVCDAICKKAEEAGYTAQGETFIDGFGDGAGSCRAEIEALLC